MGNCNCFTCRYLTSARIIFVQWQMIASRAVLTMRWMSLTFVQSFGRLAIKYLCLVAPEQHFVEAEYG